MRLEVLASLNAVKFKDICVGEFFEFEEEVFQKTDSDFVLEWDSANDRINPSSWENEHKRLSKDKDPTVAKCHLLKVEHIVLRRKNADD